MNHHQNNGGMSRYDKIKHYHKCFLNREIDDNSLGLLAKRFSEIVVEKVVACQEIAGAKKFLENNYSSSDLWLISATPEEELNQIVYRRGLSPFFKGIYGYPNKKTDAVKNILSNKCYSSSDCLFIGDAMVDMEAARDNMVDFCFVKSNTVNFKNCEPSTCKYIINNFLELI